MTANAVTHAAGQIVLVSGTHALTGGSFFARIVDAWVSDLTTNIPGLASAVTHKYAMWNPELFYTERDERHLAVFPTGEPETTEDLLVDGSVLAQQNYSILVWEDTGGDAERLAENPSDDASWLSLYEAIRARLFLTANLQRGSSAIMRTRYQGGSFDRSGHLRSMEVRFAIAVPHTFS